MPASRPSAHQPASAGSGLSSSFSINGQSGWTWMADRGGTTANHYDHIHVTVYS